MAAPECPATPPIIPEGLASPERTETSASVRIEQDMQRPTNSTSPEPNCPICLQPPQNKCYSDTCFHKFCFECLLEWSKVKTECPLCKKSFKSIIHNVKSSSEYEQHTVEPPRRRPEPEEDVELYGSIVDVDVSLWGLTTLVTPFMFRRRTPGRHQLPSVLTRPPSSDYFHNFFDILPGGRRRPRPVRPHPITRLPPPPRPTPPPPLQPPSPPPPPVSSSARPQSPLRPPPVLCSTASGVPSHLSNTDKRRFIYRHYLWAVPLRSSITTRIRECSLDFFVQNPAMTHRLLPWITRDLSILCRESEMAIASEGINAMLLEIDLRSPQFLERVNVHLGRYASQFVHELICFARSPYDICGYDRVVLHGPYYDCVNRYSPTNTPSYSPSRQLRPDNDDSSDGDIEIINEPTPSTSLVSNIMRYGQARSADASSSLATSRSDIYRPPTPISYLRPSTGGTSPISYLQPSSGRTSPISYLQPSSGRTSPISYLQPSSGRTSPISYLRPSTGRNSPISYLRPSTGRNSSISYLRPSTVRTGMYTNTSPVYLHSSSDEDEDNKFIFSSPPYPRTRPMSLLSSLRASTEVRREESNSDVEVVAVLKPKHERTPEIVDLISDGEHADINDFRLQDPDNWEDDFPSTSSLNNDSTTSRPIASTSTSNTGEGTGNDDLPNLAGFCNDDIRITAGLVNRCVLDSSSDDDDDCVVTALQSSRSSRRSSSKHKHSRKRSKRSSCSTSVDSAEKRRKRSKKVRHTHRESRKTEKTKRKRIRILSTSSSSSSERPFGWYNDKSDSDDFKSEPLSYWRIKNATVTSNNEQAQEGERPRLRSVVVRLPPPGDTPSSPSASHSQERNAWRKSSDSCDSDSSWKPSGKQKKKSSSKTKSKRK